MVRSDQGRHTGPLADSAGSEDEEISVSLGTLRGLLDEEEDLNTAMDRLARTAVQVIGDATAVSLTVISGQGARTVAATDAAIARLDELQYRADEGPCLEAARTRRTVRLTVPEAGERWPTFVRAAVELEVRAYLSAPLIIEPDAAPDGAVAGALNLYGDQREAFDSLDEALLSLLTGAASAAIVNARRYRRFRDLAEQMKTALSSRAIIDQAKGALMAVHGVSADGAFDLLARRSQETNTKLRDVAQEVLVALAAKPTPPSEPATGT